MLPLCVRTLPKERRGSKGVTQHRARFLATERFGLLNALQAFAFDHSATFPFWGNAGIRTQEHAPNKLMCGTHLSDLGPKCAANFIGGCLDEDRGILFKTNQGFCKPVVESEADVPFSSVSR